MFSFNFSQSVSFRSSFFFTVLAFSWVQCLHVSFFWSSFLFEVKVFENDHFFWGKIKTFMVFIWWFVIIFNAIFCFAARVKKGYNDEYKVIINHKCAVLLSLFIQLWLPLFCMSLVFFLFSLELVQNWNFLVFFFFFIAQSFMYPRRWVMFFILFC